MIDPNLIDEHQLISQDSEISFTSAVGEDGAENKLFLKYNPIATILVMSTGPIMNVVGLSVGEMIDLYFISNRFADSSVSPVQVFGFLASLFTLITYIGYYFAQCLSIHLPNLIGAGRREDASHVTVDILRIGIAFCTLLPAGLYFLIKPIVKFMGCPDDLVIDCIQTYFPIMIGQPLAITFSIAGGFLQGTGKSFYSGVLHLSQVIVQVIIFTPLFLYAFKIGPHWVKLSTVLSQIIFGIGCFILIFVGKFTLKPDWHHLFGRFSPETGKAMLLALPMLLNMLAGLLPPTLILNFMTKLVDSPDAKKAISAVLAVFVRIQSLAIAFPSSLSGGFLSSGSHANGAKNYKRLLAYYFSTFGISEAFVITIAPILIFKPGLIAGIFLNDKQSLQFAELILPIPFYSQVLQAFNTCSNNLMITLGKRILSLLAPIITMTVMIGGCYLMSLKSDGKPQRIMFIYPMTDITLFLIYIFITSVQLYKLNKLSKEQGKYAPVV